MPERIRRIARRLIAPLSVSFALFAGCSATPTAHDPSGDPLLDLRNPNLRVDQRVDAVDAAWDEVLAGVRDRGRTRQIFKDLAWSVSTPEELRAAALERLLLDPDPAGEADARRLAALLVPREPDADAVTLVSEITAERGWTDLTPALVRSLSRPLGGVAFVDRPEFVALQRLHPGEPVEDVVFEVFVGAGEGRTDAAAVALQQDLRLRADAWALLAVLDPSGSARQRLVQGGRAQTAEGQRLIEDLRASAGDLGCLPDGAQELLWLRRLRRPDDPSQAGANAAWWGQASSAIRGLGSQQRELLRLRHAEPVRWAAENRPAWLAASREQLLAELQQRLDRRDINRRRARVQGAFAQAEETLKSWRETVSWGDLLATLVVDEALQPARAREKAFVFTELDRSDRRTEYGGVIESAGSPGGEPFRVVLYRPRERDRTSDTRFVASDDMIRLSDRALAHYHLQVQQARNGTFAGPSGQDLVYAATTGRTCVVFTSLDRERLGVDVYFPSGVVLDLGEIRDPRSGNG